MMLEQTQILWSPAGMSLPSLGSRALVDISDGDTPNIRMPIRMLSIDTPEVTAKSLEKASKIDHDFTNLAEWIRNGIAPVSKKFGEYIIPKLESGNAGTLQFTQGKNASAFHKEVVERRLTRTGSTKKRNLFVRSSELPFDKYGRLLAYVAPSYSKKERKSMTRRERATFNLDMVESGWAAPFVLFPNIPGELDLPLFLEMAVDAKDQKRGQYQDDLSLPGYEYRMCEKLYAVTKKIVDGESLTYPEKLNWRSRYCADVRNRKLFAPESYFNIPEPYRLWVWPDDVRRAISMLNLVPFQA
jgi:endonuclease YncB( thermonuclease family)